MKRIWVLASLLLLGQASSAAENATPAAGPVYGRSSVLAFVSKSDDKLDAPLLFLATRSSVGTIPDRYELNKERPLLISPTTLFPPWDEKSPNYVFVVLPCAKSNESKAEQGPSYLAGLERTERHKKGYYTDVYRAQYQYGRGSELVVLDVRNSKADCGVSAYRAKDGDGGRHLEQVQSQPVDLQKVFVCEMNVESCG